MHLKKEEEQCKSAIMKQSTSSNKSINGCHRRRGRAQRMRQWKEVKYQEEHQKKKDPENDTCDKREQKK